LSANIQALRLGTSCTLTCPTVLLSGLSMESSSLMMSRREAKRAGLGCEGWILALKLYMPNCVRLACRGPRLPGKRSVGPVPGQTPVRIRHIGPDRSTTGT